MPKVLPVKVEDLKRQPLKKNLEIEYKRSVTHYNKAIKLDPEIESAYSNRGEAVRHGYT